MVLRKLEDGRPIVDEVIPGSFAEALGVKVDDVIAGVEGNVVNSYEAFLEVIEAFPRPVTIRLHRSSSGGSGSSSSGSGSGSGSGSSSSGTMREKLSNLMGRSEPAPPPLRYVRSAAHSLE